MTDVFISYKRQERDKAHVLAESLVQRGLDVWWDVELLPGDRFQDEINAVLYRARMVVVLWTAEALKSSWVKREASHAMGRHIYVPAQLEPLALPVPFNTIQVADLSQWKGDAEDPALERFVGTVVERLKRQDKASISRTSTKVKEVLNEPAIEVEYWRSVSNREHHSVEEYQSYLDRFGDRAAFAELAKLRIEELSRVDSVPADQQNVDSSNVPVDRPSEQDLQQAASSEAVDLTEETASVIEPVAKDPLNKLRERVSNARSVNESKKLQDEINDYPESEPQSTQARSLLNQVIEAQARFTGSQDAQQTTESENTNKLRWTIPVLAVAGALGFGVWRVIQPPKDYIPPDMVRIPAGIFMMGSDEGEKNEQPVREVSVPAFEMQRHELTWAEWEACEAGGGCREDRRPWERFDNVPASERSTHPVVYVNVDNANDYIRWINEKTGLEYRLPSEAEWEYAARAGSSERYSWGPDIGSNRANCRGCNSGWDGQSTAPVGSFEANEFGLHDMHGNVWEWTADCWHKNYAGAPADGSAWVDNCTEADRRPLRGGSWNYGPESLRAAVRIFGVSGGAYEDVVGFRLARSLP